jgi:MFS family permease
MPVPPRSSSTQRLDVEAALGAAGLTPFHRKAVAITGMAWTFVAMEILLIGFTLPLFGSLWNLSATWLGWIGASALAGSLVGSLLLGRLADQIGRRQIFQASILW